MTLPEVGELWEYKQAKQLLRVLVLGVRGGKANDASDGVRIQTINIVCEGFGEEHDEWWFSTSHNVKNCWKRLA